MRSNVEYKSFGDLVNFDKRFQGVDNSLQKNVLSFAHVSAEELQEMAIPDGDVKLLSTGLFDGYTNEATAGEKLSVGEVITIPSGGSPSIKYYKGKFVDSGNILCSSKNASVCLKYIYYALLANMPLLERSYRGASIKHPKMSEIWEIPIPALLLSEQELIVKELDAVSDIIADKRKQLQELSSLVQAIFFDTFGDSRHNTPKWVVKKMKDICIVVTDGDHLPPPKSDDGIPFITISDIDKDSHCICFDDTMFVPRTYYEKLKDYKKAKPGDILYTVTGSYGIPIIVKENKDFCFQRHIGLLRPSNEVEPEYLSAWCSSPDGKQQADREATGIAQKTVSLTSLRNFNVPVPPIELQRCFAQKVQAIEEQKELILQSVKEFENLLAQRMEYHFA